jgi:hypothetical protein
VLLGKCTETQAWCGIAIALYEINFFVSTGMSVKRIWVGNHIPLLIDMVFGMFWSETL